jgi:glycyl-tRNA synthetase
MNPQTWVASGHIGGFSDPLMDCKECKTRHRADNLIEDFDGTNVAGWSNEQMMDYIKEKGITCPNCGKQNFTDIRQFNLMFKTFQGVTEDSKSELYLRPETAQGIFVNFANIQRTTRKKVPFGVAQVGKSFRNEITPGNFIFRVREFEQMELEFFCKPGTDLEWFDYWRSYCKNFLLSLGLKEENIRLRDHDKEELCFYSKATTDFEYLFPFGWGELWGVADRTDYDLTQHINTSGKSLEYFDPETNEKYIPYVIEPSLGVERLFLSVVTEAYDEEEIVSTDKDGNEKKETRTVMHFHPALAPFKAAVLPLVKKLTPKAEEVYDMLSKRFMVDFDETGTIGKRYRRQDEIGTPFCITYDFDTLEKDNCVTVRDRDTMQQERVNINDLVAYLEAKMVF